MDINRERVTGLQIISETMGTGSYLLCVDNAYCFEYTLMGTCYYPSNIQLLDPKHFTPQRQQNNEIDKRSVALQVAIGILKIAADAM